MMKRDLDADEYTTFICLAEGFGGHILERLNKEDEMRFLEATIKVLLFQGFELSHIIAVWNDTVEGKE